MLLLNGIVLGEDPHVTELIKQEMLPEILANSLVEYPFQMPPDDAIWGPINLGMCEETGAPAGIHPHEVHFFACGGTGSGKSTLFKHLIRQHLGGLTVVSLGEPFRSEFYIGWFVPYEIRLGDGTVKSRNLALRNDNAAHRYVVDGGI